MDALANVEVLTNLQELTGQESGIVIHYGDGQGRPSFVIGRA